MKPYYWIIGGLGLMALAYFMGRGRSTTRIKQVPLPKDNVGGEISEEDAESVRETTLSLYEDMEGIKWSMFSRNEKPYRALLNLSDRLFVAVYNDFNNLYGPKNKGTLSDWIRDEKSGTTAWEECRRNILNRMNRLNLK